MTLAFLRPGPRAPGTWQDGDPRPPPPSATGGESVGEAVRTGWFWLATAALMLGMLGMLGQVGALSHPFDAVPERLDATAAAATVSTMALAGLAGRVLGSAVLGRVVRSGSGSYP